MHLPPFNPKALCVKCGHTVIQTVYRSSHAWMPSDPMNGTECMIRLCSNCQYCWHERTKDFANNEQTGDET